MPESVLEFQSGTNYDVQRNSKRLSRSVLEAVSLFVIKPNIKYNSLLARISITTTKDERTNILAYLAVGYCTPGQPLFWTGKLHILDDQYIMIESQSESSALVRLNVVTYPLVIREDGTFGADP